MEEDDQLLFPKESLPGYRGYQELRAEAYRLEADPLYFQSERGEISKQVWLDKIEEIKERFPSS